MHQSQDLEETASRRKNDHTPFFLFKECLSRGISRSNQLLTQRLEDMTRTWEVFKEIFVQKRPGLYAMLIKCNDFLIFSDRAMSGIRSRNLWLNMAGFILPSLRVH